ncbi:MAG: hypothetical protein ACK4G3_01900 [bacterium]
MKGSKCAKIFFTLLLFSWASAETQKGEEVLWAPDEKLENKAVPAISVGDGIRLGMVVVAGPEKQVDQVKAVAVLEGDFKDVARYRVLIPVSSEDVLKNVTRVPKTAVIGLLDWKISRAPAHFPTMRKFFLKIDLGQIVGGAGIFLLVQQYGEQINKAINSLLVQKKVEVNLATKVVPIVSGGKGLFVGAAQVTGANSPVQQVKAVAQVETTLGKLRGKALFPIRKMKWKEEARVSGVGISALIDARLSKLF